MITTIAELKALLEKAWNLETCAPGSRSVWSSENKSAGQCGVTSLVVHDYFGGEIRRCKVGAGTHYFNFINGELVDLTAAQFHGLKLNYDDFEIRTRDELLSSADTLQRYELLKKRIEKINNENHE